MPTRLFNNKKEIQSMRIVYIILSHKNHEQTLRLFNRLNMDGVSFVFHISTTCDPGYFEEIYSALKDRPNCYFAERAFVRWGDAGDVQAALNAIDTISREKLDYDYAFLLSGQCYPLKSHEVICRTLEKYKGKQFLEYTPFSKLDEDYFHRIVQRHFWLGNLHFWYPHQGRRNKLLAALLDLLIFPFMSKRKSVPPGYLLFKGSLWWTLTKDCVQYLYQQSHSENGRNLMDLVKKTYHAGETYFQTVLMNSEYKDSVINKDLRYILWEEPEKDDGHPEILTTNHFDGIASSDCLFGRKFDMKIDSNILDMIDESLLERQFLIAALFLTWAGF
jgi:hypothetical protein